MWLFREPPKPAQPASGTFLPSPATLPVNPPSELTLRLRAQRNALVRLKVDGVLSFEGRIPAGSVQDWKARREFDLRSPSPEDLRTTLDEREIKLGGLAMDAHGFRKITR